MFLVLQLILLFNGFAFGKINGRIPQSIATVPSLIYLGRNITLHPGVPEKSFVIHNIIVQAKTIPTVNSLHLESNQFHIEYSILFLSTLAFQDLCIV
jgi:hypothetical protein